MKKPSKKGTPLDRIEKRLDEIEKYLYRMYLVEDTPMRVSFPCALEKRVRERARKRRDDEKT